MPTAKFEEGIVYRVCFRKASNVEYELVGRYVQADDAGDLFFATAQGTATKVPRDKLVWVDEMPSGYELQKAAVKKK